MSSNLQKVVGIEWNAQKIVLERPVLGPKIVLVGGSPFEVLTENYAVLVMQGSYDPPTLSHIELIKSAIKEFSKLFGNIKIHLLLLLSLSHVEKSLELTKRTILSSRVEMLELVLSEVNFGVPVSIGLSNVARYLDLIVAVRKLQHINRIAFILGMDVFRKIFDQKYYAEPLERVLPKIFSIDYFVAGRDNVQSVVKFHKMIEGNLWQHQNFKDKIHYLTLPKNVRHISSTVIRNEVRVKGKVESNLLIKRIYDYVTKHKLYTDDYLWIKKQTIIFEGVKKSLRAKLTFQKTIEFIQFLLEEQRTSGSIITNWQTYIERSWDQFRKEIT